MEDYTVVIVENVDGKEFEYFGNRMSYEDARELKLVVDSKLKAGFTAEVKLIGGM